MRFSLIGACAGVALRIAARWLRRARRGSSCRPHKQIAAAVSAAPAELRDGAAVLGLRREQEAREAARGHERHGLPRPNDPSGEQFHVACYHKLLEPFMARGRSLRAEGVKGPQVDTVRFKEIKSGKLRYAVHAVCAVHAHGSADELRPGNGEGDRREVALRGLHPGRDREVDTGSREKPAPACRGSCIPGRRRRTSCSSRGCDGRPNAESRSPWPAPAPADLPQTQRPRGVPGALAHHSAESVSEEHPEDGRCDACVGYSG